MCLAKPHHLRQDHIEKLQKYQEMVEETIDLNSDPHQWVLLPSLDNDLQRLRDELNDITVELDAEHKRVGKDLGVELDKKLHLENHQVYKYSFRITKAVSAIMRRRCGTDLQEAGLIRNRKGYTELSTQKSGTIFTTSALRALSEQYEDLNKDYDKTQRHLVREVVQIACM